MEIEAKLVQNIVDSMKEIINQELNFISTKGIIIASTDQNRIGMLHGGALEVIRLQSDLIIEFEGQYEGTKKGINIPIYIDQNLLGVIGITGEKEEVEKYGKIIKKMTEILIKEAWLKDVSFKKRENYRILFEQLIINKTLDSNTVHLTKLLEIDPTLPRIVTLGMIKDFTSVHDSQIETLTSIMHKVLATNNQHFFNINGAQIRIVFNANEGSSSVKRMILAIVKQAKERAQLLLSIGVGNVCSSLDSFQASYTQAVSALNWATLNSESGLEYYKDLDLGIILTNLPMDIVDHFIKKVLGALSAKEMEEYHTLLNIYGKNKGSNYKTADELFIHKNTLQYKLTKLHKITEYNPREIDDYAILSLAFKLWDIYMNKKRFPLV